MGCTLPVTHTIYERFPIPTLPETISCERGRAAYDASQYAIVIARFQRDERLQWHRVVSCAARLLLLDFDLKTSGPCAICAICVLPNELCRYICERRTCVARKDARRQTRQELLNRVDIAQPLAAVLCDIARRYNLGHVHATRLITQGYDDLNVVLTCAKGRYVVKLFNQAKSVATIEDHVRVQLALSARHAPVPRILTLEGVGLASVPGRAGETLVCVSEFFAGDNFAKCQPEQKDTLAVTRFLATLHRLPYEVVPSHDSWGTLNLPYEFARKKDAVSAETVRLVEPLADAIACMNFGKGRRRIIHGDLQRKHVLRDNAGRYCVLDFGCIDYSYPIVDLGIFLALFCLEGVAPAHAPRLIADVLDAYCAEAPLPARHITLLGTLIRATWASYLLAAEFLMRQGDQSYQTRQWYRFARQSLRAYMDAW